MTIAILTTKEVAGLAGVTPQAVRDWARSGRLRAHGKAASGLRVFTRKEVDRYLKVRSEKV